MRYNQKNIKVFVINSLEVPGSEKSISRLCARCRTDSLVKVEK